MIHGTLSEQAFMYLQGVAGTAHGTVWYINWPDETKVRLVCGHADQVTGVATSSDGQQLATCCRDGTVAVWNMENLEQTVVFQTPKKVCFYLTLFLLYALLLNIQECLCIAFTPPPSKTRVLVTPSSNEEGHPPHHHSSLLAAGYSDGCVRIFNTTGTRPERKIQPHGSPVTKIAFSADGR